MITTSSSNVRHNGIFFDVQESCIFHILLRYSAKLDNSVLFCAGREKYKHITYIQVGESDVVIHRIRPVKTVLGQYEMAISVVMQ
jgi:hypothetical protein